jgi:uncharacterized protein (DUF362 family)
MLTIKKKYLVDEKQRPVGVVLDMPTFRKIEELLEDFGLLRAMQETDDEPVVPIEEARKRFPQTRKRK